VRERMGCVREDGMCERGWDVRERRRCVGGWDVRKRGRGKSILPCIYQASYLRMNNPLSFLTKSVF